MKTMSADKLWKTYPGWRLHCEVTASGQDSYRIVMSMSDRNGDTVRTVEHYGSGNLAQLKDEALQKLQVELEQTTK